MANEWSIIRPQAATNLITNPSVETATTGYSATSTGTTIAAGTTYVRRGYRSLTVTPTSSTGEGAYFGTITMTSGTSYTASVDVLGVAAIPYSLYIGDTSGTAKATTSITGSGYWKRQTVTWACDGTASYRVYLCKGASASTAAYYLDGLQVEATAYATTYIDGDQTGTADGYKWTGTPNASTSTRSAQERAGGREYYLDTDITTRILLFDGVGVAPLEVFSEQRALLPGAEFQGTRTMPREMTLVIQTGSTSAAGFHSQRKDLIDLVKPDLVSPEQPFVLRYYGANTSTDAIEISVVYAGGLELNSPTSYRVDKVAMRLVAFDPYWYELGNASAVLDIGDSLTTRYIAGRIATTGQWSALGLSSNPTTGGTINAIAINPKNPDEVYIGGDFTGLGGTASRDYLAKYTISTGAWATVGVSINAAVYALCFNPNGDLFIGGAFTNAGGEADADYICQIIYGSSSITALASGGTGTVYALAWGTDNKLYFGGDFALWAGDGDIDYIGYWDNSSFTQLVANGSNGIVYALHTGYDGNLYIGGAFTDIGGTTLAKIAKYNYSTFDDMNSAISSSVRAITSSPDGVIYATTGALSKYNGQSWESIGASDYSLAHDGKLLHYTNGIYLVSYNGSSESYDDAIFEASWDSLAIAITPNGDLFIGGDSTGASTVAGTATITNNGTSDAYPIIEFEANMLPWPTEIVKLYSVRNNTIGAQLSFSYQFTDEEILTISTQLGNRKVESSRYGNKYKAMSRGSELAKFRLQPGTNQILALATASGDGTPTIAGRIKYRVAHWSIDGIAA